jgi:hypothetical protein
MKAFDFYVYNKRTERKHSLCLNFEVETKEEAKELFLKLPDSSWRYDLISVDDHTEEETILCEGDFLSDKVFKRTIFV